MPSSPTRCANLVMKGGITSGVIYPRFVEQTAHRFHLVGIAGTSAGAIASSLAAAAEMLRRRRDGFDDFSGFEEFGALGAELASGGKLLELFTPDRSTRRTFDLLMDLAENGFGWRQKLRVGWTVLSRFQKTLDSVRDNGFGLCSGMANGRDEAIDPLTPWLSRQIDRIAGQPEGEPLTLRHLREARRPPLLERLERPGQPSIDFRAVTTCLTFGRPYEIPFKTNIFAFDPDEWRQLFPAYVVDHLVKAAEAAPGLDESSLARDGKLPLPVDDLPVIVATRMSLSFPVLFGLVPLWSIDRRRDPEDQRLERVWFSDGGITSNFPMHRFDSLYPLWPTLGITLASARGEESVHPGRREPDVPDNERMIYLPSSPSSGVLDRWNRFDAKKPALGNWLGFAGAVFGSAKDWHDNSFLKLPGYRDRLVEVSLTSKEGGLNLSMESETITALVDRGTLAGTKLTERFTTPLDQASEEEKRMGWDAHRWTRFRTGMRALTTELLELRHHLGTEPMVGGPSLDQWLDGREEPPTRKHSTRGRRDADREALAKLVAFLDELAAGDPRPFEEGPEPAVEYGTRAPL